MIHAQRAKLQVLLASASQTNSATRTANLDCLNSDYATIVMNFASAINTNGVGPTISLLECDTTVVTSFATFNSNFELSAHSIASAHQVVYHVDTRSRKRYLRLSVTTATATNDNVTMGAIGLLTRQAEQPGSTSEMVGSTNDSCVIL